MTKKWIAINLMMLLTAGLLGWQLNVGIKAFNEENSLDALARNQARKKGAAEAGLPASQPTKKFSESDFAVVAEQDLFAESRKREEKTEAPPPPENRVLDIKPILVGIIISGSQRLALINDPAGASPQGTTRKAQTIRLGDNYRGFVVTDITESGMVLEYGASREVIPLNDTAKPMQSGKTPILATRVVNFGPGPAGGTTIVAPSPVSTASAPGRLGSAAPAPTGSTQRTVPPPAAASPARGFSGTGPQGQPVGGGQAPQGANWNQGVNSQGQTVINSPFGQFTVPAPQPVKK